MAKIYEKPADKEKEEIVASVFCSKLGLDYGLAPARSRYDFHIIERAEINGAFFNCVVGMVEVKVRTCSINQYPTFFIDAEKKDWMCRISSDYCTPYLLVAWTDAIGFIDFRSKSFLGVGGRYDRQDPSDHKLIVHYSIDDFSILVDRR